MNLVIVTWVDAGMKMGWQSANETATWAENERKFAVTSVGYLFGEHEDWIVLVGGVTSGNLVCNPLRIRRMNILDMEVVHYAKNTKPE